MVSLIEKHHRALINLCQKHYVKRLDVFGSAAVGDFDQSSDIDLLVEFDDKINPRRFDNYFDLRRSLMQLFGRPIDLVEPGALHNPYFIKQVNQTRRNVYASSA